MKHGFQEEIHHKVCIKSFEPVDRALRAIVKLKAGVVPDIKHDSGNFDSLQTGQK